MNQVWLLQMRLWPVMQNGEEEYFDVIIDNNKHITGFKATALSLKRIRLLLFLLHWLSSARDMGYGHDVIIKVAMTVNKR